MNIHIIVCGWYYNRFNNEINDDLISGLYHLKENNSNIYVHWSCHKDVPDLIKEKFAWKQFKNIGLEWGAYDQMFKHLDALSEFKIGDILFFLQDDLIIKDWKFLELCVSHIQSGSANFIGNGFNYHGDLDPTGNAAFYEGRYSWSEFIHPDTPKELFKPIPVSFSIRGSFLCTSYDKVKQINGFEYVNLPLNPNRPDGEIDGLGNGGLYLNAHKFTVLDPTKVKYISNYYRQSKYIIECARGQETQKNQDNTAYILSDGIILTNWKLND